MGDGVAARTTDRGYGELDDAVFGDLYVGQLEDGTRSVELSWETARPEPTRVEIRAAGAPWGERAVPGARQLHRIRVDDLKPGTAYAVRAADREMTFETRAVSLVSADKVVMTVDAIRKVQEWLG